MRVCCPLQDRLVDRLGIDPADVDPAWHDVRVRHALSMTLGHSTESVELAPRVAARLAAEGHPDPFSRRDPGDPARPAGRVGLRLQPAAVLAARHDPPVVAGERLSAAAAAAPGPAGRLRPALGPGRGRARHGLLRRPPTSTPSPGLASSTSTTVWWTVVGSSPRAGSRRPRRRQIENPREPEIRLAAGVRLHAVAARGTAPGRRAFGQFMVVLPEQDTADGDQF